MCHTLHFSTTPVPSPAAAMRKKNPSSAYLAASVTVFQNGCGVFNGNAFPQGHVNKLGSKTEDMH